MATAKKPTQASATAKPATAAKPATPAKPATAPKAAPKPAAQKVEPVEAAVKASQETVSTVVKTSTEVAKKGVEKAVAMSQEQVAVAMKAGDDAYKGYEEMIEFSKSNIDAFVKTNEILSAGIQEINSAIYQMAQANLEESVEIAQKFMTCGTVVEVIELQQKAAQSNYEKGVSETRKISELSIKVAEEASKPLSERVTVAIDTFSKPIAA